MSKINTFLQKRKMHESRHGIFMVALAYVLSIMLLFLGSDVFYNIKSTAAGINMETDEVTEELITEGEQRDELAELRANKLQENDLNPLMEVSSEDTVWILGRAMSAQEYDALFDSIDSDKADNASEDANGTIQSLSIETAILVDEEPAIVADTKEAKDKEKNTKDSKSKSAKKDKTKEVSSKYAFNVTAEEVEMLERIVQAEAGSEDIKGRILVANVVLNRVKNDHFPDTIEDVIFQNSNGEYQFSPVSDKRFWSVKVSKKTKEAVQRALEGEDYSKGALYFMARKRARTSSAKWFDNNLTWLFKHGGHEFYK